MTFGHSNLQREIIVLVGLRHVCPTVDGQVGLGERPFDIAHYHTGCDLIIRLVDDFMRLSDNSDLIAIQPQCDSLHTFGAIGHVYVPITCAAIHYNYTLVVMQPFPYWQRQTSSKALFPDIEWNRPEQRAHAGKLGIVGGNKLGFVSVGDAYATAGNTGIGQVRVLLPQVLKKSVPPILTDVVFAPDNPSGGLSREAGADMRALGAWADAVLLIGDAGRNSETAILYEDFLRDYHGQLTITRDAVDLLLNTPELVVERDNTLLVVSFAQLQKLFTKVYYPKILTFSMQLQQLVETIHKFTITYPVTIMTFHQDHLVVASAGHVTTTPWDNPMAIWKGHVATQAAAYWLWNPKKPLEAATASLAS